ncbi:MAG: flagellar protein FlaG [Pseudomonadota bacterium]
MSKELSSTAVATRAEITRSPEAATYRAQAEKNDADRAMEARRKKIVEEIARSQGLEKGRLVIEKDTETGRFVHKLVDPESGKIVRQWPDEQWLSFARSFGDTAGLWLDRRV